MISDYDDMHGDDHQTFSWKKVTRRRVDPVTFACHVDVTHVPRIEDCSYETTNWGISQPRFGGCSDASTADPTEGRSNSAHSRSNTAFVSPRAGASRKFKSSSFSGTVQKKPDDASPSPSKSKQRSFLSPSSSYKKNDDSNSSRGRKLTSLAAGATNSPVKIQIPVKLPLTKSINSPVKQRKTNGNKSIATRTGGGTKVASLGAFFSQASIKEENQGDDDDHSIGSKSLGSRSISDRSNAEMSKAEMKLRSRRNGLKSDASMMSIDEGSVVSEFNGNHNKSKMGLKGDVLSQFFHAKKPQQQKHLQQQKKQHNDDDQSVMSASTISSKSIQVLSTADRSKNEIKIRTSRDNGGRFSPTPKKTQASSPVVKARKTAPKKAITTPLKSCVKKGGIRSSLKSKKLDFSDDIGIVEVPTLDDKEHYRDWDAIWYDEDELAEFRYEAFMEEAGLDIGDYN